MNRTHAEQLGRKAAISGEGPSAMHNPDMLSWVQANDPLTKKRTTRSLLSAFATGYQNGRAEQQRITLCS